MTINLNDRIFFGFHNPFDGIEGKAKDPNFSLRRLASFVKRPGISDQQRRLITENLGHRIETGFDPVIFDRFPFEVTISALAIAKRLGTYRSGYTDHFLPKVLSILKTAVLAPADTNYPALKPALMVIVARQGYDQLIVEAFNKLSSSYELTLSDYGILSAATNKVVLREIAKTEGLDPVIIGNCILKSTNTLVPWELDEAANIVAGHPADRRDEILNGMDGPFSTSIRARLPKQG